MKLAMMILTLLTLITCSCVSMSGDDEKKISPDLPPAELARRGIEQGGQSLQQVIGIVREKRLYKEVSSHVALQLNNNIDQLEAGQVLSACQLYQATTKKYDLKILSKLVRHSDEKVRKYGWLMASSQVSPSMAAFIEREASIAIVMNSEAKLFVADFALAVRKNQVADMFSLLKMGLLSAQEASEFAKAMADLNPALAAEPFFDYLSRADLEDLRQINQTQIDPYACLVIMRYFMVNSLPISHPNLSHIFMYAVSRNPALSELAKAVLDYQIPKAKEHLVYHLATLPVEVQIAFIEAARRNPSANFKILLSDLKKATRFEQVVEEIEAIKIF